MPHTREHPLPVNPIAPAPQVGGAAPAPVAGPQQQGAVDEWLAFFEQPETRAALLQFGVNMLQPQQPGDTTFGQIGRAVGAGAQAAGRVQATKRTAAELTEKQRISTEKISVAREGITAEKDIARGRTVSAEKISREKIGAAGRRAKTGIEADIALQTTADIKALGRLETDINAREKAAKLAAGAKFDTAAANAYWKMIEAEAGFRARDEASPTPEELARGLKEFMAALEGEGRPPPDAEGVYNFLKLKPEGDLRKAAEETARVAGASEADITAALERLKTEGTTAVEAAPRVTGRETGFKESLQAKATERLDTAVADFVKQLEVPNSTPQFSFSDREMGLKALELFMQKHPNERERIEEAYSDELEFWAD